MIQLGLEVRRKLNAGRATYSHGVVHQFAEESAHVIVIANDTQRLARGCGHTGGAGEQHKLLPEVEKHVIRQPDIDVGSFD
jgi:hypothetical protein